jgi:murein DD-endopeptidase MepM/ murein hydrolase activator NlpD
MSRWIGWPRSRTEAATRTIALVAVVALLSVGAVTNRYLPGLVSPDSTANVRTASAPAATLPLLNPAPKPDSFVTRVTSAAKRAPASVASARGSGSYRRSARVMAALADLRQRGLLLPLPGLSTDDLRDSFLNARGDGTRRHFAIDMPAPAGTPILSVDDGTILGMRTSAEGGISLFVSDATGQFIYYYAHLKKYHPLMEKGRFLLRGDTIGFVGTSGNAPENMPHLHFAILLTSSLARWSSGTPINPAEVWRKSTSR